MNTVVESNETSAEFPDAMSATRHGKIARLPRHLREALNHRLAARQTGREILAWINSHPEARQILQQQFAGKAINHQNLSDWRRNGFEEWRRYHFAEQQVRKLAGAKPSAQALRESVVDGVAKAMTIECLMGLQRMREEGMDAKKRFKCICEGLRELHAIRRQEHRVARAKLAEEREALNWSRTQSVHRSAEIVSNRAESRIFKVIQGEKMSGDARLRTGEIKSVPANAPSNLAPASVSRTSGQREKVETPGQRMVGDIIAEIFNVSGAAATQTSATGPTNSR